MMWRMRCFNWDDYPWLLVRVLGLLGGGHNSYCIEKSAISSRRLSNPSHVFAPTLANSSRYALTIVPKSKSASALCCPAVPNRRGQLGIVQQSEDRRGQSRRVVRRHEQTRRLRRPRASGSAARRSPRSAPRQPGPPRCVCAEPSGGGATWTSAAANSPSTSSNMPISSTRPRRPMSAIRAATVTEGFAGQPQPRGRLLPGHDRPGRQKLLPTAARLQPACRDYQRRV